MEAAETPLKCAKEFLFDMIPISHDLSKKLMVSLARTGSFAAKQDNIPVNLPVIPASLL